MTSKIFNKVSIGIDLGTMFTCVSTFRNGRLDVIPNGNGQRTTPSCVSFTQQDELLVGETAMDNCKFDPARTFYDCKRLIGRRMDDRSISNDIQRWSFAVQDIDNKPQFNVQFKGQQHVLSPTDMGAIILRKMKTQAESFLFGKRIEEAVITVPAYFSNSQRTSTVMAGEMAGLHVIRIVNEPTAAAIAYCYDNAVREPKTILVFDLGGGTFDVSLVNVDYSHEDNLLYPEVVASSGDGHLGGQVFTLKIRDLLAAEFFQTHPDCLALDKESIDSLMTEAEVAKKKLSSQQSYRGRLRQLQQGHDFDFVLTQEQLMEACDELINRAVRITCDLLNSVGLTATDVATVLLVGGSTRMEAVRSALRRIFNQDLITTLNADEDVARGAALLAASLCGDPDAPKLCLRDITPVPLGISVLDDGMCKFSPVVPKYTVVPCCVKEKNKFKRLAGTTGSKIDVYEGFNESLELNTKVGTFMLLDCPKYEVDVPLVVEFTLNQNGILMVNVIDVNSGRCVCEELRVGDVEFTDDEVAEHGSTLRYLMGEE